MAWRPTRFLIEGILDNTRQNKVTGWMKFTGMKEKVSFDLDGDFHRDIRGARIHIRADAVNYSREAQEYMKGFCPCQIGKTGDMTAGLPPADFVSGQVYLEWYSKKNGRVVIELEQNQVELLTMPISVRESEPISRERQNQNMAEFLGEIADAMKMPQENAVCIGNKTVIKANNRMRSMNLLTQEIRKKLPPLYAQDGNGGKAIAYVKFFAPFSNFSWFATEFDGKDTFFGLVDGHFKELGYFSLSELESIRGPMGLTIERDLYWKPRMLEEISPETFQKHRERG